MFFKRKLKTYAILILLTTASNSLHTQGIIHIDKNQLTEAPHGGMLTIGSDGAPLFKANKSNIIFKKTDGKWLMNVPETTGFVFLNAKDDEKLNQELSKALVPKKTKEDVSKTPSTKKRGAYKRHLTPPPAPPVRPAPPAPEEIVTIPVQVEELDEIEAIKQQ